MNVGRLVVLAQVLNVFSFSYVIRSYETRNPDLYIEMLHLVWNTLY
jgi:hypothetical protein